MRLYYYTTSTDRIGNRHTQLRVTEKYTTKSALKKHHKSFYGTLKEIYTEKNIIEKFGEDILKKFEAEAKNMD